MDRIGSYELLQEVARGGQGTIYRARGADGQQVAVKVLHAQPAGDRKAIKRFQGEVEALTGLRHPNVVSILDSGAQLGSPWLALEFVEGTSLEARLRAGPLPVWEAIRVAQHLAQALAYVHACGVLHRDLKPSNVLLRGDQVMLTDFGIARDEDASVSRLAKSGALLGTPGFWPPEQVLDGAAEVGPRADVYGLGAVLYACLTGEAPIRAETLEEHLLALRVQPTAPPRSTRPEVPPWLDALCMRCLDRDPQQRPPSAEAVAAALAQGRGAGSGARKRRPPSVPLLGLALGALALLLLAAWAWSAR